METKALNETKFLDPVKIINQIEIKDGDRAADFGCGSGFFSIEIAKKVGESGSVYSLDILPSALEAVASRAKTLGINNIITKRANLEGHKGSGLETESMNLVVIKDMLFQNKNKEIILKEAYKILKQQGKTVIVEWDSVKESGIGPEENLRVSKENLKNLVEGVGFKIEKEIEAGNFHYCFLLSK
jgi:ubiquinone/menaquinone biosynthesis C-methylase UbiE